MGNRCSFAYTLEPLLSGPPRYGHIPLPGKVIQILIENIRKKLRTLNFGNAQISEF